MPETLAENVQSLSSKNDDQRRQLMGETILPKVIHPTHSFQARDEVYSQFAQN